MMTTRSADAKVIDVFAGNAGGSVDVARIKKSAFSETWAPGDIEKARVPHPDWETILKKLTRYRIRSKKATDPYCLMITGDTGVGKSTLINHYMLINPPYETEEGRRVPVLKVITPSKPTLKALINAAIIALIGRLPHNKSAEEQTALLIDLLKIAGVEQVIFDEFQHVIQHGHAKFAQESSDWLKTLIEHTSLSIALVGLEDSEQILIQEQLNRRFMDHVRLPRFVWSEGSLKIFGKFLDRLEEAMPLEKKMGLGGDEMVHRMFYATDGMMGYVMRIVRHATYIAEKAKQTGLSPETLSRGYRNHITKRKPIDPFLADYEKVKAAAEQEARERVERRKQEEGSTHRRPVTSKDVFKTR